MSDNITLPREELERALEALQKTMGAWNGTCAWHADVKSAISTLRARLAQPEQRPEHSKDGPCVEHDGCPTEKAVLQRFWRAHQKPEQRPEPDGEIIAATGSLNDVAMIKWISNYHPKVGDKIYANSPPPRQELSEEEIASIARLNFIRMDGFIRDFARAIERKVRG